MTGAELAAMEVDTMLRWQMTPGGEVIVSAVRCSAGWWVVDDGGDGGGYWADLDALAAMVTAAYAYEFDPPAVLRRLLERRS